jgi:hypothetical protein
VPPPTWPPRWRAAAGAGSRRSAAPRCSADAGAQAAGAGGASSAGEGRRARCHRTSDERRANCAAQARPRRRQQHARVARRARHLHLRLAAAPPCQGECHHLADACSVCVEVQQPAAGAAAASSAAPTTTESEKRPPPAMRAPPSAAQRERGAEKRSMGEGVAAGRRLLSPASFTVRARPLLPCPRTRRAHTNALGALPRRLCTSALRTNASIGGHHHDPSSPQGGRRRRARSPRRRGRCVR